MPPRDWAFRIQDILEAIAKIQRYVSGVDFGKFENDEEIMDAIVHNLTVIGEAANHIPDEITSSHTEIPWRQDGRPSQFLRPCLLEPSPFGNLGHHSE